MKLEDMKKKGIWRYLQVHLPDYSIYELDCDWKKKKVTITW